MTRDPAREAFYRAVEKLRLPELQPAPGREPEHREARNLHTTSERLVALATLPDEAIRLAVLQHPDAPESVLAGALASPAAYGPREKVLQLVAVHPHGRREALEVLARDEAQALAEKVRARRRRALAGALLGGAGACLAAGLVVGPAGVQQGSRALLAAGTALLACAPLLVWLQGWMRRGFRPGSLLLLLPTAYLVVALFEPRAIVPLFRMLLPILDFLSKIG